MKDYHEILEAIQEDQLIQLVISRPKKATDLWEKIMIRPVLIKEKKMFQIEKFSPTQAFHDNVTPEGLQNTLRQLLEVNTYKQWDVFMENKDLHILFNKRGDFHLKQGSASKTLKTLNHNQKKQYLLNPGDEIPFLVALGVMTPDYQVVKRYYDKFRQINRFVELVADAVNDVDADSVFHIVDFGSGKSYLTFALYHYLVNIKGMQVAIVGLDLKADVIADCEALRKRLGYEGLSFCVGDITDYTAQTSIDMVVSLHACDTATDAALKQALKWDAKIILTVPCCQKQMNQQISKEACMGLLDHGLIKERVSALFTDAIRAKWLEAMGYQVQIIEFVDMTHTPKNLMIRGIKKNSSSARSARDLEALEQVAAALDVTMDILLPCK